MNYISTLLECISIVLICKKYMNKTLNINLCELIIIISDVLIANMLLTNHKVMLFFLGQLMIFLICLVNANSLSNAIYLSMLSFITLFVLQIIASIPAALADSFVTNIYISELLGNTFTLIIVALSGLLPLQKIYIKIISTTFTYKVSLSSSYLLLVILLLVCQQNIEYLYSNIILFVAIMIIVIISNVLLLYYEKVISLKNTDLEYYRKYLPVYENLINDIRASQHEFTNRIQALQILCDSAENNDFARQLREYTNTYSKPLHAYPLLTVNSPLFVASLYSLYLKGESEGIAITFDVSTNKLESCVSEIMLSDLACILLQNAIEASKPGDNIYVHIHSENGKTIVEVRNLVERLITDEEISGFFNNSYSTKNTSTEKKKHGLGLYYLNRQININKGELFATCISYNKKYWMIFRFTI